MFDDNKKVRCWICPRACGLFPGEVGYCGVRINEGGQIISRTYGLIEGSNPRDPIEKKPLYHFLPGTRTYSIGGIGCNLSCLQCQNWTISQQRDLDFPYLTKLSPEKAIREAKKHHLASISLTYNEPTVNYEYCVDVVELARKNGLKTILVTNGYLTRKAAEGLASIVDAANVDVKAFTEKFYYDICGEAKLSPVLRTVEIWKAAGMHVETTTLLIPGKNDVSAELEQLAEWCASVDPEMPVHFSRFHPAYRMREVPVTPLETLEMAYDIAKSKGVKHVYVGNVPGHDGNSTFCSSCGEKLIQRAGYSIKFTGLKRGGTSCKCGTSINISWQ
ncbi:MAG: AmmeMemoRadiSam system radical SAM enzyme [Candidatus Hodarchaeales archaeon]|jgi:pyruvate formate lyase activating enzyme